MPNDATQLWMCGLLAAFYLGVYCRSGIVVDPTRAGAFFITAFTLTTVINRALEQAFSDQSLLPFLSIWIEIASAPFTGLPAALAIWAGLAAHPTIAFLQSRAAARAEAADQP